MLVFNHRLPLLGDVGKLAPTETVVLPPPPPTPAALALAANTEFEILVRSALAKLTPP